MSRYREPLSMGRMLKRILLYFGVPIVGLGMVLGFIVFLRAPNEIHLSLRDDSAGATESATATSQASAGTSASAPTSTIAPASVGSVGGADPVEAATEWLTNYRAVSWEDPAPTAWLGRLAPYITPQLEADYENSGANPSTTGDWNAFVSAHCASTVQNVSGEIAADKANTPNETQVNITGTVTTTCTEGDPPDPAESVTAVVSVTMVEPGRWLVGGQVS